MIKKWISFKLRTKLLIIYILGSLLPMLALNGIFLFRIVSDVKEDRDLAFRRSVNNMSSLIHQYIEDAVVNLHFLYQNKPLYKFTDTTYKTQEDFISVYKEYYEDSSRFFTGGPQISSVKVYTTNPTILNTGEMNRLDSIDLDQEWYSRLKKRSPEILLYYTPDKPHIISIIRQMDFYPLYQDWDKIAKIDINIKRIINYMDDYSHGGFYQLITPEGQVVIETNKNNLKQSNLIKYTVPLGRSLLEKGWRVRGYSKVVSAVNFFIYEDYILILFMFLIVIYGSLSIYILSKSFYLRIESLVMAMHNLNDQNIESYQISVSGKDEIGQLTHSFNNMIFKIRDLIYRISRNRIKYKEIELAREKSRFNALLSQINPHYLFNVLETIRMKSLSKNENETADVIALVASSYRHLIEWSNDMVPLETELKIVQEFLEIQKYRFEDCIKFNINCNRDLYSIEIPRYSIQPFVENACIHGLESTSRSGYVNIDIYLKNSMLYLRIEDNGVGIDSDKLSKIRSELNSDKNSGSLGIKNIYQRLKRYYNNSNLEINSVANRGTVVEVKIPYMEVVDVSNVNS